MPSRGSATPPDRRGVGGGGGVSGQMADTHTSNWLLAVAQRADENMIRRQALVKEVAVLVEESAPLADESTGLGAPVEVARKDFNATLTGPHDVQTPCIRDWAQWKKGRIDAPVAPLGFIAK